jgi:serine/threonine protein phosphatase PrpC
VEFHALTEIGAVRETHEDAIVIGGTMAAASGAQIAGSGWIPPGGMVFAVTDGMGGYAGGAAAAGVVAVGMVGAAGGAAPGEWAPWLERLSDRVAAAGGAWGTPDMGATAVVLVIRPGRFEVVNVGDCRAYLVADGAVTQLSVDDRITTARGEAVTQSLGGPSRPLDPHLVDMPAPEAGARLILCSDGLFGAIPRAELHALLARPGGAHEVASALAEAAYRHQSRDNFSLAVLAIGEAGADQERGELLP